jgi:hypothetical protein
MLHRNCAGGWSRCLLGQLPDFKLQQSVKRAKTGRSGRALRVGGLKVELAAAYIMRVHPSASQARWNLAGWRGTEELKAQNWSSTDNFRNTAKSPAENLSLPYADLLSPTTALNI